MEELKNDLEYKLFRENLKVAPISKRIISMTIDDFLVSFIVFIAFYNQFSVAKTYEQMLMISQNLFMFIMVAFLAYHYIFIALYGKTLGKIIMKIRCVDISTFDKPDHFNSFIRSFVRIFSEQFFYLGMFYAYFDKFNRAIHDIAGKCVVVEDIQNND